MSVPFNTSQRLIVIMANVFGPLGSRSIRLALDTAATETVISPRILKIIGYSMTSTQTVPIIMGGGVVSIPLITVSKLEAIGQVQSSVVIQAHTLPPALPVDGLLGLDFIRGQRLVVDYRTGTISLT